jgi:hypothetical protein
VDKLAGPLPAHFGRHIEQPAVKVECLFGIEKTVQIRLFGQKPNPLVLGNVGGVAAKDQRSACRGKQQAQQQLDGGRFARPVRSQKPKHLTAMDR